MLEIWCCWNASIDWWMKEKKEKMFFQEILGLIIKLWVYFLWIFGWYMQISILSMSNFTIKLVPVNFHYHIGVYVCGRWRGPTHQYLIVHVNVSNIWTWHKDLLDRHEANQGINCLFWKIQELSWAKIIHSRMK